MVDSLQTHSGFVLFWGRYLFFAGVGSGFGVSSSEWDFWSDIEEEKYQGGGKAENKCSIASFFHFTSTSSKAERSLRAIKKIGQISLDLRADPRVVAQSFHERAHFRH